MGAKRTRRSSAILSIEPQKYLSMKYTAAATGFLATIASYTMYIDPDAAFKTLSLLAALNFDAWYLQKEWAIFVMAVLFGYSIVTMLTQSSFIFGRCSPRLEVRARRLEDSDLRWKDYLFVTINKLVTVWYVVYGATTIRQATWVQHSASTTNPISTVLINIGVVLLALGCYDLIYVPFHRLLHAPMLYKWIHKHHHRQAVPFRGTFDGINTHPLEFAFGEFLHIWALRLVGYLFGAFGYQVPFWGCLSFLICGGLMASLNHTRFGLTIPFVYNVRNHDVHHRKPKSNYCQFVPWYDVLLGTFEAYKTTKEAKRERELARTGKLSHSLLDERSLNFQQSSKTE
jgi:sterol desaturase/sphingolipid hydroxylase (fatty acid hydroxylase superfamily)